MHLYRELKAEQLISISDKEIIGSLLEENIIIIINITMNKTEQLPVPKYDQIPVCWTYFVVFSDVSETHIDVKWMA